MIPLSGGIGCLDDGLQACSQKFASSLSEVCEAMKPEGSDVMGFLFAVKVCEFPGPSGATNSIMAYGPSVSQELSALNGGPNDEFYCYYSSN
jgi:hypothetical protein